MEVNATGDTDIMHIYPEYYKSLDKDKRNKQFDNVYMKIAEEVSTLSYATKAKVGCIILSDTGIILSHGWNGTPHGFDNCCEYWDEQLQSWKTKPEVVHAESNAILKCARTGVPTQNSTLYVTLSPCIDCAKLIMQAQIKRVVYLKEYKSTAGIEFLRKCGIIVEQLKDNLK